ncbi:TetR/AcrR family transcriptional regulator [Secundilactobacillus paracollinoides]|uniref:HTH tetR-type domain-containing protein n=3 Tax=Secundilactobacillus paracollinoides TaxID=240427 RepID=A0A1B2J0W7_9LACO|nr:hypothetical protein AYR61_11695 [Secundilactobacillus paracollinoides]ANZ67890.1 hypothetical protein AYR63_12590 [Secundilactobacillus paracollinoides]
MTLTEQPLTILDMRYKDQNKIEALHQAVIDVMLHDGYQNLSVAKIAKRAGVSQATLYIYYADKQAMLGQAYLNIKNKIDPMLFSGVDPRAAVEDQFRLVLKNYADAMNAYPREGEVMRIFNSHADLVPEDVFTAGMDRAKPLDFIYQKGVSEGILRELAPEFIIAYTFTPLDQIAEIRYRHDSKLSDTDVHALIDMAWQACRKPQKE